MLKRHQACIDLAQNALVIQGRKIPFLAEHELPKNQFAEIEVDE
jgi:DNA damage-inducible protein 1